MQMYSSKNISNWHYHLNEGTAIPVGKLSVVMLALKFLFHIKTPQCKSMYNLCCKHHFSSALIMNI